MDHPKEKRGQRTHTNIQPIKSFKNMKDSITTEEFTAHSNEYGKLSIIKYFLFGFHFWTEVHKAYTTV